MARMCVSVSFTPTPEGLFLSLSLLLYMNTGPTQYLSVSGDLFVQSASRCVITVSLFVYLGKQTQGTIERVYGTGPEQRGSSFPFSRLTHVSKAGLALPIQHSLARNGLFMKTNKQNVNKHSTHTHAGQLVRFWIFVFFLSLSFSFVGNNSNNNNGQRLIAICCLLLILFDSTKLELSVLLVGSA